MPVRDCFLDWEIHATQCYLQARNWYSLDDFNLGGTSKVSVKIKQRYDGIVVEPQKEDRVMVDLLFNFSGRESRLF